MSEKAERYIWQVESYLMSKYGVDVAYRDIDPLIWYISTGRASLEFLRLLSYKRPYLIGRKLHEGGSVDEIIKRIKDYIGYSKLESI